MSEIVRVGVDRISLRDVSHTAGLTHGATYARFEDSDELLAELWNSVLRERLRVMFELSLSAAQDPSTASIGALFELLHESDIRDLAAIELLLASRRIPVLHEECESFIHDYLNLDEGTSSLSRAIFSRSVLLFSTMVVRLYSDAHFGRDDDFNHSFERLLVDSLRLPPADVGDRDVESVKRRDVHVRFKEGDSLRADLAFSTLGVVSRSGYVGATISRIARRANCSPAAIYKSHHSKEDLVVGTLIDILGAQRMNFAEIANVLNGGVLAGALKAGSEDANSVQRNFVLELFLAAAHHEQVREAIRHQFMELESSVPNSLALDELDRKLLSNLLRTIMAVTTGAHWLATLSPTTKELDFAQFTEPLVQAFTSRWQPDWSAMSKAINNVTPRNRVAAKLGV